MIFPAEKDFLSKSITSAIERKTPILIRPALLPGDLIVILVSVNRGSDIKISPQELVEFFTNVGYPKTTEGILTSFAQKYKIHNELFISLSQLKP